MGENKECRMDALAYTRDDYIFECAMKNPTPTIKESIVDTISATIDKNTLYKSCIL